MRKCINIIKYICAHSSHTTIHLRNFWTFLFYVVNVENIQSIIGSEDRKGEEFFDVVESYICYRQTM